MRIAMTLLALSLAVAPAGCKKKKTDEGTTAGSGSAMMAGSGSDMGSGSAMAGSGSGSSMAGSDDAAAMAHKAGMCPSTVLGATTKADIKGKDVVVTISADDKDAIKAIQTRTDEMLKARLEKKTTGEGHDQRGTHGGKIGLCPVHIPEGATAKSKHDAKGVTVTITPKDKPDELKTEIDGRITKATDWMSKNLKAGDKGNEGGVGGGSGKDGMNRSGQGDGKGMERQKGNGSGGGAGTGGGGGKGTGGGSAANK